MSKLFADIIRNRGSRGIRLQVSAMPTTTYWTVRLDSNMPNFTCQTVYAQQQPAIIDDSASNPGADRDIEDVAVTPRRSIFPFTQGCHIGVVTQKGRDLKSGRVQSGQGEDYPTRGCLECGI